VDRAAGCDGGGDPVGGGRAACRRGHSGQPVDARQRGRGAGALADAGIADRQPRREIGDGLGQWWARLWDTGRCRPAGSAGSGCITGVVVL
jgi:hypothetical protein